MQRRAKRHAELRTAPECQVECLRSQSCGDMIQKWRYSSRKFGGLRQYRRDVTAGKSRKARALGAFRSRPSGSARGRAPRCRGRPAPHRGGAGVSVSELK